MEYYFLGKKEPFDGLEIAKKEKEWIEYPVIKISFGGGSYEDKEKLLSMIDYILGKYEKQYNLRKHSDNSAVRLSELIETCYEQTGKQVVQSALEQIDANGYSARFAVSGKKMFKVGVVFSSDGKGMVGWKY